MAKIDNGIEKIIDYMHKEHIPELWNSRYGLRLSTDKNKKIILLSTDNYGKRWLDLEKCNNTVKARTLEAYDNGDLKLPKANDPREVTFMEEVINYMNDKNITLLSNEDFKLESMNGFLYSYKETGTGQPNKRLFVICPDNVKELTIQSWEGGYFDLAEEAIAEKPVVIDNEVPPSPPTVIEEKVSNYHLIKEAVDASPDKSWAKIAAIEDEVVFKPIKLPTIQETLEPVDDDEAVEEPVDDDEADRLRTLLKYSAKEITKGDMSIHYLMTALSLNLDYVKAPIIQFPGMVETSKEVLQDLENGTDPKSLIPKLFKAYYKEMGENMSA